MACQRRCAPSPALLQSAGSCMIAWLRSDGWQPKCLLNLHGCMGLKPDLKSSGQHSKGLKICDDDLARASMGKRARPQKAGSEASACCLEKLSLIRAVWFGCCAQLAWVLSQVQVSGQGTTRESICVNELMMRDALKHLGPRPSVQTCMLHLKSLYDLMRIDIPGS